MHQLILMLPVRYSLIYTIPHLNYFSKLSLLKTSPPSAFDPQGTAGVPKKFEISTNTNSADWDRGVVYANAQNLARTLSSWNGIASESAENTANFL
jgi:hypothetical protein